MLSLTFNVLFLWILKTNSHKKHKHTMNQFWFGDNQCQIFALLARFLNSSFTRRFLFSSLESVVKWNVVFVYTTVFVVLFTP